MKLFTLIIALFFCSIQLLQAQANESPTSELPIPSKNYYKRAYLGMSYGFAIPMGTFSANTISEGNSAYAEGGSNFSAFEVGYRVRSNFFVSGKYMIIRNGVDESIMEDELQSITGFNYQISASDYNLKAVMLGAGLTKRSNAIDIDLRFYMGFGTTYLPTYNVLVSDPNSGEKGSFIQQSDRESGLGGGLSLGLRFHLNEYLDFHSSATYFILEKTFDDIQFNDQNVSTSLNLTYETLSINFGIAYRFIDDSPPKNE